MKIMYYKSRQKIKIINYGEASIGADVAFARIRFLKFCCNSYCSVTLEAFLFRSSNTFNFLDIHCLKLLTYHTILIKYLFCCVPIPKKFYSLFIYFSYCTLYYKMYYLTNFNLYVSITTQQCILQ